MRRCAHQVLRSGPVPHDRMSEARSASQGNTHAATVALVSRIADLVPAPPTALARDSIAWSAFEALLDQAATGLAEAIGPEGRTALEAVTATPLEAGPVGVLLAERTLGRLARITH